MATLRCPSCRALTYETEDPPIGDMHFAHCTCGHLGTVRREQRPIPGGGVHQDLYYDISNNDVPLNDGLQMAVDMAGGRDWTVNATYNMTPAGEITLEDIQTVRQQLEEYASGAQRYIMLTGGMRASDRELRDRMLGFPPGHVRFEGELQASPHRDPPTFDINGLPLPVINRDFQFTTIPVPDNDMLSTPPWNTHDMEPGQWVCKQCGVTRRELTIYRHSVRPQYNRAGACRGDFRMTALVRVLTYSGRTVSNRPLSTFQFITLYDNQPVPPWLYTRQEAAALLNHLSFTTGLQNSAIQGLINGYSQGDECLHILADAFEEAGLEDHTILMVMRDTSPVPQGPYPSRAAADAWRQLDLNGNYVPPPRLDPADWRIPEEIPLTPIEHASGLTATTLPDGRTFVTREYHIPEDEDEDDDDEYEEGDGNFVRLAPE